MSYISYRREIVKKNYKKPGEKTRTGAASFGRSKPQNRKMGTKNTNYVPGRIKEK